MKPHLDVSLLDPLTEREMEILTLLAEGLSNREIAQKLNLSLETIKWYNRQIYSKLAVGNRTEAVVRAREIGLFNEQAQPATVPPGSARLDNLPAQLSSFVGRETEISEVNHLLESNRLVTLTGAGGAGKTRLSLAVAASVIENYANGVFFIPLVTADSELEVPKTIAHELGIMQRPNQSLTNTILRYLRNKELLLLLDNFEHVMPAATLVGAMLAEAPDLSVLVTSREALNLTGEYNYQVPPLRLPDPTQTGLPEDLLAAESVTLFVQRTKAVSSNFQMTDENAAVIAKICLRLDGLPLAIELAAARIKLFSPQQLLNRLENSLGLLVSGRRDLPDRQRTLRQTIDWSYNLLNEVEQSLFSRMAVFRNGCSLEAVEAICGFEPVSSPLDRLSALIDKSLVYQSEGLTGDPRFYMLETIHEYAREKLTASGEGQVIQDRHLSYYVSLVEEMEPGFLGRNQRNLLFHTESEMGNIREAFRWALEAGQVEMGARLISAIGYYFYYKDGLVEGYQFAQQIIKREEEISPPHNVRLFLTAGRLAWYNNDIALSNQYIQQAQKLVEPLQDNLLKAWCLVENSNDLEGTPGFEKILQDCQKGLDIFRELNYLPGIAYGLNLIGELTRFSGDLVKAQELYEEALAVAKTTGEAIRQHMLLGNLSFIAYQEGEFERSRDLLISVIKLRVEFRTWQWGITALGGLAGPVAKLGQPEKAARLLGATSALMEALGIDHQPEDHSIMTKILADVKDQMTKADFEMAWQEGQSMTLQQAITYALET